MLISRNLYNYCSCCVETFRHDEGRGGMWRWISGFNHLRFAQRDIHRQSRWQTCQFQEHPRGPSLLFGPPWLRYIRHHVHPRHQTAIHREIWWFIFLCWCWFIFLCWCWFIFLRWCLHNTINIIAMTVRCSHDDRRNAVKRTVNARIDGAHEIISGAVRPVVFATPAEPMTLALANALMVRCMKN